MREAGNVAEKALCLRAKCGCVIVSGKEIVGRGYNAPPLDKIKDRKCHIDYSGKGKPGHDMTCCMHAEWRAITNALYHYPEKIKHSTLYFTRVDNSGEIVLSGEPYCTVCSRLALDFCIGKFVLWQDRGICVYGTEEYNNISYEYELIRQVTKSKL